MYMAGEAGKDAWITSGHAYVEPLAVCAAEAAGSGLYLDLGLIYLIQEVSAGGYDIAAFATGAVEVKD